jgi:hypothetical protein
LEADSGLAGDAGADFGIAFDADGGSELGGEAGDSGDAPRALDPICVTGGSATEVYCDVVIQGDGFDQFEGVRVNVRHGEPSFQRLASGQTRVVDGKFTIQLPKAHEVRIIYKRTLVHFDADDDATCGPGDQMFYVNVVGSTALDGSTERGCPSIVFVDSRNSSAAATAMACELSASVCPSTDAGP